MKLLGCTSTEVMLMGQENAANTFIDGEKLACVDQFIYLQSLVTNKQQISKKENQYSRQCLFFHYMDK
jgi:hypothetical protein